MAKKIRRTIVAGFIVAILTFGPFGIQSQIDTAEAYGSLTPCGKCQ